MCYHPRPGRLAAAGAHADAPQQALRRPADGGTAPKTIRNIHGVLSKALADAERWGLVGRNSARLADVPAVARPKLRVWSPEQTRAFLAAVANDWLFAAWLLAATTGMRRGELLGLRWEGIDVEIGVVRIARAQVRAGNRWWLASRRRPVAGAPSPSTRPPWRRCASTANARPKSGWPRARTMRTAAWPSPCRPAHPSTRTDSAYGFGGTSRRLGCRPSGCTTCATYATAGLAAGVPSKVMSERLGHATVAFTLDTYTSALPAMDRSAADVVAGLILGTEEVGVQDPPDDYGLANRWQPSQCDGGFLPEADDEAIFEHGGGGQGRCCYRLSWLSPLPRTRGPLQAVVAAVRP